MDASLPAEELLAALRGEGPLLLELYGRPSGLARLDLLEAVIRFRPPLLTRFSGLLATPLVEVACLSTESEWEEGTALELAGMLLSPLLLRVGLRAACRLLATGRPVRAEEVLQRAGKPGERSPEALAVSLDLIAPGAAGLAAPLARERAAFGLIMACPDRVEGVKAFRERRPPRFDW